MKEDLLHVLFFTYAVMVVYLIHSCMYNPEPLNDHFGLTFGLVRADILNMILMWSSLAHSSGENCKIPTHLLL